MAVPYYNYISALYEDREARKIQRKVVRDVCDPFDLQDPEFERIWRMNKSMALFIIEALKVDLEPQNSQGLPAHFKVLCSIQYLANGGYQRQIGQDHTLCHAQTTVSKYLDQFTDSIYRRLFAEWVHFPGTGVERANVAAAFTSKYNVPDMLGLIGCTHVKISPPSGPQGAQYKNRRKDAHTINVQLIVDSECRILNVNARYPGRVHDAFIWRHSNVRDEMKRLTDRRIGKYFLLGDSGYPLEPWLMTPILHPENASQERYTDWHCRVRNGVKRANGYLKGTLRCLGMDQVLHYEPEKASKIIYASCIVYNLMKHYRVSLDEGTAETIENVSMQESSSTPADLHRQAQARQADIVQLFTLPL